MSKGFTLIELLIVILIIGVIATVIILVLNPVQLLKQARDSRRLTDLRNIKTAVNLYQINDSNATTGSSSVIYVSLPDAAATSSAGTDCRTISLPSPPPNYVYHCSSPAAYRKSDGTGWVPINLDALPTKSPLTPLPVDPVNTSTNLQYYSYIPGWAAWSSVESDKFIQKINIGDTGYIPYAYITGTTVSLIAPAQGLTLWSKFDEGTGNTTADFSGGNTVGTLVNNPVWSPGKVGSALLFSSADGSKVNFGNPAILNNNFGGISLVAWVNLSAALNSDDSLIAGKYGIWDLGYIGLSNSLFFDINNTGNRLTQSYSGYYGSWHFLAATFDGTNMKLYIDGALVKSMPSAYATTGAGGTVYAGGGQVSPNGLIDEIRIYNRPLSGSEILALYNSTK